MTLNLPSHLIAGWWFQPIWKICSSNWKSSPNRGENKKNIWNHHLDRENVAILSSHGPNLSQISPLKPIQETWVEPIPGRLPVSTSGVGLAAFRPKNPRVDDASFEVSGFLGCDTNFPRRIVFPQGFLVEKPKPIFGKKQNSTTSNLDQFSQEEVNKKQKWNHHLEMIWNDDNYWCPFLFIKMKPASPNKHPFSPRK